MKDLRNMLQEHELWLATRGMEGNRLEVHDDMLAGCDLSGANLSGADLCVANLSGADLSSANLYRARLRGADLRGANLSGADLSSANLYHSNLTATNFTGADLTHAGLAGADFMGAYGIYICPASDYTIIYTGRSDIIVGCVSHTLEEWLAITLDELHTQDKSITQSQLEAWKQYLPSLVVWCNVWHNKGGNDE